MRQQAKIRLARPRELEAIVRLIDARLPDLIQSGPQETMLKRQLSELLEDGCLIVAEVADQYAGVIALDLMQQQLVACYLNPSLLEKPSPRRLITAAEKRALRFGLRTLRCNIQPAAVRFMLSIGYELESSEADSTGPIPVRKSLEAIAEDWMRQVFQLHRQLGIADDYGARHRLTLIEDCRMLKAIGQDIYEREQWLYPAAEAAWRKMRDVAASNGVVLQVVSAFRSRNYQAGIIRSKLERGLAMERILSASAAPGFSQHHSGRALDLKAPGSPALEQSFAETDAYRWLSANARYFGFAETLGQSNRHGIIWEPWHWYYKGESPESADQAFRIRA